MKIAMMLKTEESTIAEIRTAALSVVNVSQATLSTKLQSGQLQVTRKFTLEWQRTISRQDTITKLSFKDLKHSHDTVLSKHIKGQQHQLRHQMACYQEGKCLQRKPFPLQFMSVGKTLHLNCSRCFPSKQEICTCYKMSPRKQVLHHQSEEASLQPSLNLKIQNLKLTPTHAEHVVRWSLSAWNSSFKFPSLHWYFALCIVDEPEGRINYHA